MNARIVVLPGDGIGPEIVASARRVLDAVVAKSEHSITFDEQLIGGAAIDATGEPLPEQTLAACRYAHAVLLGAVGGPKWDDPNAKVRPEQGLLQIRKGVGLFANLRAVEIFQALADASALRPDRLRGVDLLMVKVAIVLGGMASTRQAIQRLGRVLRRSPSGEAAQFYEIVTDDSNEVQRSRDRRRNAAYKVSKRRSDS